jgi:nucleoside-diphosphate kinase
MQKERSFVFIKPDGVQRGLVGEIITRFERAGLKIIAMKMVSPNDEHFKKHYEGIGTIITRRGEKVYTNILKYVQMGPIIGFVLEGIEASALVRKIIGATEPKSALPGTIRGDYAHSSFAYTDDQDKSVFNLVHGSENAAEAELEISLWFTPEEIYNYKIAHEHLVD